ncbi:GTPase Era [Nakamurella antarctica]|uniref:GTPase Era n=1 Tax=Nakamurella antarctica TaxID=1902245 RepID=A0A3G8ZM27_9ACTN|nr:GTPase Era [Nakamurella antarctica]AZI58412.1 GTPase Era [Nakamurella antarctica]
MSSEHRSGFGCFVGRPNTGKSTLLNAVVGQKIAITSDKPQTTRRAIRGIVTREDSQLIIVDTPGMHRPRTLLGERLGEVVRTVWSEVDVIGFTIPANEKIGPGDRRIAEELTEQAGKTPVIGIVTKTDLVKPEQLVAQLMALERIRPFADIIPVSAKADFQVQTLLDLMVTHIPVSPRLYPDAEVTDEPVETRIAEIIREATLDGAREELPHSLAALVSEILPREGKPGMLTVFATIYVERESQKAIVLGKGGEKLAAVGRSSRTQIEELLGSRVYLDLHVTVAKEWQRDPKQLRKLGFDA